MTRTNLRLQKSIAAFELLVLVLDNFYAVDNLHETGLQSFGLSGDNGQSSVLVWSEKGPGVEAETMRSHDVVVVEARCSDAYVAMIGLDVRSRQSKETYSISA
jgi:hypothetical protein